MFSHFIRGKCWNNRQQNLKFCLVDFDVNVCRVEYFIFVKSLCETVQKSDKYNVLCPWKRVHLQHVCLFSVMRERKIKVCMIKFFPLLLGISSWFTQGIGYLMSIKELKALRGNLFFLASSNKYCQKKKRQIFTFIICK